MQRYSGRYVIIYIDKLDDKILMFNDASALRKINYGFFENKFVVTSSIKLFLTLFDYKIKQCDKAKKGFINSASFKNKESSLIGTSTLDDRLNKLLANHYLNIHDKQIYRTPIYPPSLKRYNDILLFSKKLLKNSLVAINNRNNIILPVTAGWDSRILLAASKSIKDDIEYYVFKRKGMSNDNMDIKIPKKLSQKLNLNFKVIVPEKIDVDFERKFTNNYFNPRFLPKTRNIYYHYRNSINKVNITGNSGEIMRSYYNYNSANVNSEIITSLIGYSNSDYANNEIKKWYLKANEYAKKYDLDILDLFYWEQRMSNWGAKYPFEQDIAIEEFSPFNNKELILNVFNVKRRKRSYPNYFFFKDLIKSLWEESLDEPINPDTKINVIIKTFFKRSLLSRKLINFSREILNLK